MASQRRRHCEESPGPEEVQGDQEERMVLRGEDRDAFLGALSAPPEPGEKLVSALRRHREVLGASPEDALVEGFLLSRVARETVLRELGLERLDEIEYQRDALRRDVNQIFEEKPGSGSTMLKFVVVLYRRTDLSPEEFFANLRNEHGPLAERLPGLRRYVQNHVLPDPKREHPGWDAVIELYWDDRASMEAAWASPEGQAATDHLRTLADLSRTTWSVVQEHVRRRGNALHDDPPLDQPWPP